jgi:hypothetical protein
VLALCSYIRLSVGIVYLQRMLLIVNYDVIDLGVVLCDFLCPVSIFLYVLLSLSLILISSYDGFYYL